MSIIFTCAFRDIKRDQWTSQYNRSVDEYVGNFINMARNFPHPLIVYIEPHVQDRINRFLAFSNIKLSNSIAFHPLSDVVTFYERYVDREKALMSTPEYQAKIPENRKTNPEHIANGYNAAVHSKVNSLAKTLERYPQFDYYAWIDFGYYKTFCTPAHLPREIDYSKLSPVHITVGVCCRPPEIPITPDEMLATDIIYHHTASFIVPRGMVKELETRYEAKVLALYDQCVADDDQSIFYFLFVDRPQDFRLFQKSGWMTLFLDHLNKR